MTHYFIMLGILFILMGLVLPWLNKMGLGRLPGDIAIGTDNIKIYFPLGTSILVSVIFSMIYWIFRR